MMSTPTNGGPAMPPGGAGGAGGASNVIKGAEPAAGAVGAGGAGGAAGAMGQAAQVTQVAGQVADVAKAEGVAGKTQAVGSVASSAANATGGVHGAALGGGGALLQGGNVKDVALGAGTGAIPGQAGMMAASMAPALAGGAGGAGGSTPPPKSNAGGTGDDKGGSGGDAGSSLNAAQKTGVVAAAPVAAAAAQIAFLAAFAAWLKMMFFMMLAAIQSAWSAAIAMIINIAKSVILFPLKLGAAAIGMVTNVAVGAGTAMATGITAIATTGALLGGVVMVGLGVGGPSLAQRDDALPDCSAQVAAAQSAAENGEPIDAEATTLKNAQTVYSVLSSWGMADEEIAGILGNWQAESGIDPTGVETIYDEPFELGPRKLAAQEAGFDMQIVNPTYAAEWTNIGRAGIGLGQWTDLRPNGVIENGRHTGLINYANTIAQPWYTVEVQLGYMIGHDSAGRRAQIEQMVQGNYDGAGSVDGATQFFMSEWEGIEGNIDDRKVFASAWFARMGAEASANGFTANDALANSILAQANVTLTEANTNTVNTALDNCLKQKEIQGSAGMGDWYHPAPDFHKYQGNYGQDRGSYVHAGEDLSTAAGKPIFAISGGTVSHAICERWEGRSECNILIDHGLDSQGRLVQSLYVHMYPSGVLTTTGAVVNAGDQIGEIGSNGNSTGPHLHFEIWINGVPTDPTAFLAAQGLDLKMKHAPPSLGTGGGGGSGGATIPVSQDAAGAIAFGQTQLGKAYRLGANGPDIWDCSSFTRASWAAAGKTLPRTTREQYGATVRVAEADLQPGDLIFWANGSTQGSIYHVGIWLGPDQVMHAANPDDGVLVSKIYNKDKIIGYGRVA